MSPWVMTCGSPARTPATALAAATSAVVRSASVIGRLAIIAVRSSSATSPAPSPPGRAAALLSRWRVSIPAGYTIETPIDSPASSIRTVSARPTTAYLLAW